MCSNRVRYSLYEMAHGFPVHMTFDGYSLGLWPALLLSNIRTEPENTPGWVRDCLMRWYGTAHSPKG